MAKFKVLSQTKTQQGTAGSRTTFCLQVNEIEGMIAPGLVFIGYCTHHPFEVLIRTMNRNESGTVLFCETTWPVEEEWFEGAVIDSSGTNRKERFFYDHDNK